MLDLLFIQASLTTFHSLEQFVCLFMLNPFTINLQALLLCKGKVLSN